jgi:hypothetical protein
MHPLMLGNLLLYIASSWLPYWQRIVFLYKIDSIFVYKTLFPLAFELINIKFFVQLYIKIA